MNGALSSRAATGQLRHVKHDVKVPIDHFESQMGHVSQSQVVTGMFFAMEPDIVERRFGSAGGVLGSPSARKPAPVLFSESNQTVKQARQAPGRGACCRASGQASRAVCHHFSTAMNSSIPLGAATKFMGIETCSLPVRQRSEFELLPIACQVFETVGFHHQTSVDASFPARMGPCR
jgi:hypothetical protein